MASRSIQALAATLLLTACSKAVDLTVVVPGAELHRKAGDGTAVSALPLGTRLTGSHPLLGKRGWWRVAVSGSSGWMSEDTLARFPVESAVRWTESETARYGDPSLQGTVEDDYPLGTKLEIATSAPLSPAVSAVVESGYVIGFVATGSLVAAPAAAAEVDRAKRALAGGQFDDAVKLAAFGWRLDPKQPDATRLYAALLDADGVAEMPAALRASLPPAPVPSPPAIAEGVEAGETVYVNASALAIRSSADAAAKTLTRVGPNTPLTVRSVSGPWAKVRLEDAPPSTSSLELGAFQALPAAAPSHLEGYVAAGYLGLKPLDPRELIAEAGAQASAGHPEDSVPLYERALALDPSNLDVARSLVETGLATGRFDAAAVAGRILARGPTGEAEVVAVDVAYGCRGSLEKPRFVSLSGLAAGAPLPAAPPNACVTDVDDRAPCEPVECGESIPESQLQDANEEHQRAQKTFDRWIAGIQRTYPSAAYVHVEVRNLRPFALPGASLTVYSSTHPTDCELSLGTTDRPDVHAFRVELPPLPPDRSFHLWLPAPSYAGTEYGALFTSREPEEVASAVVALVPRPDLPGNEAPDGEATPAPTPDPREVLAAAKSALVPPHEECCCD